MHGRNSVTERQSQIDRSLCTLQQKRPEKKRNKVGEKYIKKGCSEKESRQNVCGRYFQNLTAKKIIATNQPHIFIKTAVWLNEPFSR